MTPLPICYLDGAYLPLTAAHISPLDRGFLFADAVYEVMPVYGGRPFRYAAHFTRLANSLAAIRLRNPHDDAGWRTITAELIERNGGGDIYIYLQVSRGAQFGRDPVPLPDLCTVFAFCAPWPAIPPERRQQGIAAVTAADTRWARCDIKAVGLLPNILLRQQALDNGAAEALLIRDGCLTEATSSSAHVVLDGVLHTPPQGPTLLPGTTRSVVEELAQACDIATRTVPVPAISLVNASEILIAGALREIDAVTLLDGRPVGNGRPGPIYQRLRAAFDQHKDSLRAKPW